MLVASQSIVFGRQKGHRLRCLHILATMMFILGIAASPISLAICAVLYWTRIELGSNKKANPQGRACGRTMPTVHSNDMRIINWRRKLDRSLCNASNFSTENLTGCRRRWHTSPRFRLDDWSSACADIASSNNFDRKVSYLASGMHASSKKVEQGIGNPFHKKNWKRFCLTKDYAISYDWDCTRCGTFVSDRLGLDQENSFVWGSCFRSRKGPRNKGVWSCENAVSSCQSGPRKARNSNLWLRLHKATSCCDNCSIVGQLPVSENWLLAEANIMLTERKVSDPIPGRHIVKW